MNEGYGRMIAPGKKRPRDDGRNDRRNDEGPVFASEAKQSKVEIKLLTYDCFGQKAPSQ
jgi:hypothetical protein